MPPRNRRSALVAPRQVALLSRLEALVEAVELRCDLLQPLLALADDVDGTHQRQASDANERESWQRLVVVDLGVAAAHEREAFHLDQRAAWHDDLHRSQDRVGVDDDLAPL